MGSNVIVAGNISGEVLDNRVLKLFNFGHAHTSKLAIFLIFKSIKKSTGLIDDDFHNDKTVYESVLINHMIFYRLLPS